MTVRVPIRSSEYCSERGPRRQRGGCRVEPAPRIDYRVFLVTLRCSFTPESFGHHYHYRLFPLTLSLSAAHELVNTFLTKPERPTGIYAFNDEYALCLLRALADRGLQIPQDVAVVGTDDISACEYAWPSLTSIRFESGEAIGRRAVDMLVSLSTDQPVAENLCYELTPHLIQRESS